jgi:hypothetical protein
VSFALIPKSMRPSSDVCRKKFMIDNIWSGCGGFYQLFTT